jgi:hypothetical protein
MPRDVLAGGFTKEQVSLIQMILTRHGRSFDDFSYEDRRSMLRWALKMENRIAAVMKYGARESYKNRG